MMLSMDTFDFESMMARHLYDGLQTNTPQSSCSNSSDFYLCDEDDDNSCDSDLYSNGFNSDQENNEDDRNHQPKTKRMKCNNHNQQAQQRQAANLRERRRMQSINEAFEGLRSHIPTLPYEKKLSKVDTLKLAISYITFLGEMVKRDKNGNESELTGSGMNRNVYKEPPKKIILRGRGGGISHSLSWHRKGDRMAGYKLFARVWTPEDPRAIQKGDSSIPSYPTGSHTGL